MVRIHSHQKIIVLKKKVLIQRWAETEHKLGIPPQSNFFPYSIKFGIQVNE